MVLERQTENKIGGLREGKHGITSGLLGESK